MRTPALYNLRTALLGYILVPVILVIGVGGAYSLRGLEAQVEARMQEDIELIARALREPLSHALERDRRGSVERALTSAFRFDRVYGVYVYDEDGEEIAGSGSPAAQVRTEQAAQLASEGSRRGEFGRAGNERVFSYFVPLTDRGERINGLLQVTRRGSDFSDYIGQLRRGALFALAGIGVVLVVVVLVGHYGAVGRHLRRIEHGMARIGGGEAPGRLPLEGPSEIRVLSGGINTMLDRISRSRSEIDERRARESDLRSRLHHSEKLAAIGRLASGVAHELGTPLSTIDGKAQQVLRRPGLAPHLRRTVEHIRGEAARMERIIRQLLDFGRRNPLQRRSVDCHRLIRSARDQVLQESGATAPQIGIPEPGAPVRVDADPVRLEQALINLLRNAVHAASTRVRASCSTGAGAVTIAVEDDGPGIDETHLPYLFDPFFTTKPVGEGTGLGMSVAYAAVSDHGGRIEVDRSPELGGARFRILLGPAPSTP